MCPAERKGAHLVPDRDHLRIHAGAQARARDGHFLLVDLVGHAEPHERLLPSSVDRRGVVAARRLVRVNPRQPGDVQVTARGPTRLSIQKDVDSFQHMFQLFDKTR